MICSFDFDGTLTRPEVHEYARELQRRGYIVCITTARCEFREGEFCGENPNADLYAVAHDLNRCATHFIDTRKRHTRNKMELLLGYSADTCIEIAFHLDNEPLDLHDVGDLAVDVTKPDWRQRCDGRLK